MGIFSPNLAGMGPGGPVVPEPKGGLRKFAQIMSRDTFALLGAGFLAGATALVYIISMFLAVASHGMIYMLVGGPVGGVIFMPQLVGLCDTVMRAMRNEHPGDWWQSYRRAWKRNLKPSLIFGLIAGTLFGFQLFMMTHAGSDGNDMFLRIAMYAGIFVATAIAKWTVLQIAVVDLPLGRLLLNSIVLSSNHPIRTFILTALEIVYWLFIVVAYPFSLLFYVLFNFWLTMLITVLTLYKPMNETFGIEKAVEEQRKLEKQKRGSEGK